ncbi:MAG TPA: DEAD/DEAH box helicase [Streptosporangiaceae bacterium]|nr:DEAD/DEAH box helicase [Streptosporangiaceae bacterium]
MLVLHGLWAAHDGLCLWAEDSDLPVTSTSHALRAARPHPFAAPASTLTALHAGKPAEKDLLLPSLRMAPLDSPELIRTTPRPAARAEPALLPWTVPIVMLYAAPALAAIHERAPAVRYGASMDYLAGLAAFGCELVARGRVLPTLDHDGAGAVARWRPVIQGPDVAAMHALVAAMPPVCRAVPEHSDPHEVMAAALAALVDAAAREALSAGVTLVPPRRGRLPARLPATEAWLTALTGSDGRFDADPGELSALARALAPWEDVGTGKTGPARATFRLAEVTAEPGDVLFGATEPGVPEPEPTGGIPGGRAPAAGDGGAGGHGELGLVESAGGMPGGPVPAAGDGGAPGHDEPEPGWRLEFLLQSIADPSLLIPAEQTWADDGTLSRWLPRPQELLLGELGRASRIYPELADGLRQARPCALDLDADGAYRFLSTAAPALDEAGFGVLLPSWWNRRARLGLTMSAHTPTGGVVTKPGKFGKDQLMDFRWRLAVGDDMLSEAEIAALAQTKAPLVRLRGQWVAVDPDQLKRGLEFLSRNKAGRMSAGEILRLAAAHPEDSATPLPVTGIQADGWVGELLGGSVSENVRFIPVPANFQAKLRPYQERGLSWLAFLSSLGLGACLADDMGLGKTVQLLALEAVHRAERPDDPPTLLLCPMSLVGNWQREAARFAPALRVYAHHGRERLREGELAGRLAAADLMVTTYATATRDIEELAGYEWRRVVLDEAQAVKNSLSQAARAVRRLRGGQRVALTGTPVENRLAELWSLMDFLNPGLLGPADKFRTRYAIPVERHGQTEPAERLRAITRPYVLRRLKTDPAIISDLPEKIEIKQYCRLTTEQASLYQSVVDDMMEKIENSQGIERRGNVLAAMAKLKQVCNHPALLLHDRSAVGARSGKVIRLEEICEEILAEGDKALLFTQFTEFAAMLLPHLAARFGTDISYLHGGTSKKRRDELVTRFQSDDGPPLFLLSLRAGGTGLNLTAANHVIHLDRWWNPAVENQATDRAFRIGQKRNVQVRKFICTGTLEEKIDEMIEEKKALANLVISDGEGWLTELSTGELRSMFELSAEAVGDQ